MKNQNTKQIGETINYSRIVFGGLINYTNKRILDIQTLENGEIRYMVEGILPYKEDRDAINPNIVTN
tara:strand:- start:235 stop:435 length:201 start_codon:yes stop_codon:yes gene_type:complete